jgi:hypothetical protein
MALRIVKAATTGLDGRLGRGWVRVTVLVVGDLMGKGNVLRGRPSGEKGDQD